MCRETCKSRRRHTVSTEQAGEDTTDGSLSGALGPDKHKDLLEASPAAKNIAHHFLERVDGRLVTTPQLIQEFQPPLRGISIGSVGNSSEWWQKKYGV